MSAAEPTTAPRRVKEGMRCCTVHIEQSQHRELAMLALEDSVDGRSLTYADELRTAVAEYLERRRSGRPQPRRQQLDAGVDQADGYGGGKLLAQPFYIHYRAEKQLVTACGLDCGRNGLKGEAITLHAANADCPRCRSILDTNAATMAKPTRAPTSKPAKKGPRRR